MLSCPLRSLVSSTCNRTRAFLQQPLHQGKQPGFMKLRDRGLCISGATESVDQQGSGASTGKKRAQPSKNSSSAAVPRQRQDDNSSSPSAADEKKRKKASLQASPDGRTSQGTNEG